VAAPLGETPNWPGMLIWADAWLMHRAAAVRVSAFAKHVRMLGLRGVVVCCCEV
jgi:hypothetical protein